MFYSARRWLTRETRLIQVPASLLSSTLQGMGMRPDQVRNCFRIMWSSAGTPKHVVCVHARACMLVFWGRCGDALFVRCGHSEALRPTGSAADLPARGRPAAWAGHGSDNGSAVHAASRRRHQSCQHAGRGYAGGVVLFEKRGHTRAHPPEQSRELLHAHDTVTQMNVKISVSPVAFLSCSSKAVSCLLVPLQPITALQSSQVSFWQHTQQISASNAANSETWGHS